MACSGGVDMGVKSSGCILCGLLPAHRGRIPEAAEVYVIDISTSLTVGLTVCPTVQVVLVQLVLVVGTVGVDAGLEHVTHHVALLLRVLHLDLSVHAGCTDLTGCGLPRAGYPAQAVEQGILSVQTGVVLVHLAPVGPLVSCAVLLATEFLTVVLEGYAKVARAEVAARRSCCGDRVHTLLHSECVPGVRLHLALVELEGGCVEQVARVRYTHTGGCDHGCRFINNGAIRSTIPFLAQIVLEKATRVVVRLRGIRPTVVEGVYLS